MSKSIYFYLILFFIAFFLVKGVDLGQTWLANVGWLWLSKGMTSGQETAVTAGQTILVKTLQGEKRQHYLNLVAARLSPDNLLQDGGFEFYDPAWKISTIENITQTIVVDETIAHSGNRSLAISFHGQDVNFYQTYQETAVQPTTCYSLTAFIRTYQLTDPVAVEVWDAAGGFEHWYGGQTPQMMGTTDWMPLSLAFCTPENVTNVQVRIRRYGGHNLGISGTAWFDDFHLELWP